MDSQEIQHFLITLAIIGTFLMIGTFLRAKVKLFQKLFLPACVIGGLLALLLGPKVFGIIPFSDRVITTASNLPGKLFSIVIATMPMCAVKRKKGEQARSFDAINIGIIITLVAAIQVAIGFLVNVLFQNTSFATYAGFGSELFMGFCGGHGVGAMVGALFESQGAPYAQDALGVAMTFATIGMIGGILIGIFVLNKAARKGQTHYIADPASLPDEMKTGLYHSVDEQPSAGQQTTAGGAIDTLGLHFGFIMMVVGVGYLIYFAITALEVPFLEDMDVWLYALLAMYIIWPIVRKLGWDRHFDSEIKSKISGAVTDFIVTAAIMSMPIEGVLEYWLPILICAVLGFLVTVPMILILNKHYLHEDWLEKSMGPLGMMTGDFITGVLLTRMADPELKSNALPDFSIAYSINTVYCVVMLAVLYPFIVRFGAFNTLLFALAQVVVLAVVTIAFGSFSKRQQKKAAE